MEVLHPQHHITFKNCWDVLMLFIIPVGGGIPGGVILARNRGLSWPVMMILYFISDVMLACVFEPVMRLIIKMCQGYPFFIRMSETFKKITQKSMAHYGHSSGPLALIMIAFTVDPMTGRAAAVAAGHGFIAGWAVAIAGDMIYFILLMLSTLWLNSILGDGTWTMIIILALMILLPVVVRRFRKFRST